MAWIYLHFPKKNQPFHGSVNIPVRSSHGSVMGWGFFRHITGASNSWMPSSNWPLIAAAPFGIHVWAIWTEAETLWFCCFFFAKVNVSKKKHMKTERHTRSVRVMKVNIHIVFGIVWYCTWCMVDHVWPSQMSAYTHFSNCLTGVVWVEQETKYS